MYAKIFESIYDGTLAENWQALVTFQQLLVLASADGVVDMTPAAISRKTGIPIEIIQAGITHLEAKDPHSRTPDMGGRRIVRMDDHRTWGWFIVNHQTYRLKVTREEKREADRARISAKREVNKINDVATCRNLSQPVATSSEVSPKVANVAHAHADADAEEKKKDSSSTGVDLARFDEFWKLYPKKIGRKPCRTKWKARKLDALADKIIVDVQRRMTGDREWLDGFAPHPETYLNQDRWEDDLPPPRAAPVAPAGKQIQALQNLEAMKSGRSRMVSRSNSDGIPATLLPVARRGAERKDDPGDGDGVVLDAVAG